MKKLLLSLFVVISITHFVRSQNAVLDSLKLLLKKPTNDTNEVMLLNSISKELTNTGDYERARNYAEQGKILSDRLNYAAGKADYYSAIGVIFYYQGNYSEALSSHFNALHIRDSLNDKRGVASSYNNIAIIYTYEKKHEEALKYLLLSLNLKLQLKDEKGLVSTYNNIGLANQGLMHYDEALRNYRLSLGISIKTKNNKGIGNAYNNIGSVFYERKQFDSAYVYFRNAYDIRAKTNYKQGLVSSLNYLGQASLELKKNSEALKYFSDALSLAKEIHEKDGMKNAYSGLASYYEAVGNYKQAYENFGLFKIMQDSIFNEESTNNALRAEMNYSFAKQQAETKAAQDKKDAETERQKEAFEAEAKRKQLIIYFISGSLVLMLVFAFFMVRSIIQKRRDNRELDLRNKKIENAYSIIETKNHEITDSINYAQRIQRAILPELSEIQNTFPESFIFYQPKDIVGGDFYYFRKTPEAVFIAAADSTGHGVPGAFMSLIGSKELSLANLREQSPGKILGQLNVNLKNTLKQNNLDATKDGMDIALVKVMHDQIIYSGANRPLWIIRKNSETTEEIKATKTAIAGFTPNEQIFDEHVIPVQKGDQFYIFTDGYSDQFGRSSAMQEQKKLTTKKFRELLLQIRHESMNQQEERLRKFILEWRGESEQLDDILIIGVRL
ncbi:MAG TPA: tetratricopeptide repeat protein [Bacteroidia bacterium]|jgi:serine phosphatase RsbU (regulator of sigma subunit)/uncharacterized protein HemY|nr:tetratricopeptide repeat protein [Bacteroidia bacterium]